MNEFEIQLTSDDWDQDKGGFHLEKSLETSVGKALECLFGKGRSISHRISWHGARYQTGHQDSCRVGSNFGSGISR